MGAHYPMALELNDLIVSHPQVLVVDDNAALRGLLRVSLQAFGFKGVVESESVESALAILKTKPIDLLITDWKMRPRDGLDLVREIRADVADITRRLPIMMLSGYSDEPQISRAKACGVNAFLTKPFTSELLAQCICDVLGDNQEFVSTDNYHGPDRRENERPAPTQNQLMAAKST
jgi:two-component system chemotaxis response regulator CheY